jgi:Flp pilus assembly protein TadG
MTAMIRPRASCGFLSRFARDRRGVAAVEFAPIALFLAIGILNTIEIARYLNLRMEIENATQMGSQAAWKTCDTAHLPASNNCPGLGAAVSAAVQTTSLGNQVTLASGSPSEGYYCVNSSGVLVRVSDVNSKPSDCSAQGEAGEQPSDYIQVSTTYSYSALFPGVTVSSAFPATITASSLMRMQ